MLRAAGNAMLDAEIEPALDLLGDARSPDNLVRELQDAADEGLAVVASSPFRIRHRGNLRRMIELVDPLDDRGSPSRRPRRPNSTRGGTMGAMTRSPLISVEELRRALDSRPRPTVLDVRYRPGGPTGLDDFRAGHVPGAAYVDLDADLAAAPGERGRHPLPETAAFEAAMRRVGVTDHRPVVVYDDWEGRAAARAWWLLRFHGHPDVRVLDGGWTAWLADGGASETRWRTPDPGDFTAQPGGMPVVGPEEVPHVEVLVDARAPERYRGEIEPIDPVAGHIPGAVNVPTTENVDGRGGFRSAAELREVYAAVGATEAREVAAYCGSGVTAAHDVLALAVAGVPAALYPGSWSEWVADPERPVATSG